MFPNEKNEILGKLWQSNFYLFIIYVTCFSFLNFVCVWNKQKNPLHKERKSNMLRPRGAQPP